MDGILIVDKPKGITSHDVVLFVRRRFGEKKVGHTGILDPMATGVLILVLGRETRRANVLIDQDKEYQAILRLGIETSTQDREGKIISRKDTKNIQKDRVLEVLYSFRGQISQIPPMVSSRRYQGKRLYELARRGIEVERKPKNVWVYDLKVEWIHLPFVSFRLSCSKGTYVRTLCHDVGNILGVGGHLYALQRTRSGSFSLEDAVSWPGLSCMSHQDLKKKVLKYGLSPKADLDHSLNSEVDESRFVEIHGVPSVDFSSHPLGYEPINSDKRSGLGTGAPTSVKKRTQEH